MSVNMSYCRFQNTLAALRECDEYISEKDGDFSDLSPEEKRAALVLLSICNRLGELVDES